MLQLLQFLGNIPLGVDGGLLPRPVGGHQVNLGLGHLDVVAKDLVGLDLHVLDTGLLLGAHLQLSQQLGGVVQNVALVVHLLIVAVPDEAALPHGEGGLVHQGGAKELAELGQVVELLPQGLEQGGGAALQQRADAGQLLQAGAQGHQVPASGGAIHHPAHEALQVGDLPQHGGELLPGDDVLHQVAHRLLPPPDLDG